MQFERYFDLDLRKSLAAVEDLGPVLFTGDSDSLKLGLRLSDGGEAYEVAGTVSGKAVLADGSTVAPLEASAAGSLAWIVVPQTALAVPGKIDLFLRITDSGAGSAVALHATATVIRSETDTVYVPGDPLPDVDELRQIAEDCETATEAAEAVIANLTTTLSITALEWPTKGYYDTSGGYHGASSGNFRVSNTFPCWPGDKMILKGKTSSTTTSCVVFYPADASTVIENIVNLGADGTEHEFTVPENCYYLRIGSTTSYTATTYLKYKEGRISSTSTAPAWNNPLYKLQREHMRIATRIDKPLIAYVDGTNGSDSNAGTSAAPFATISKAVGDGYKTIKVAPGRYAETVTMTGLQGVSVSLWDTVEEFDTSAPNREKAVLFKGDILTITSAGSGEYTASFTPDSASRFYKVFVSQELAPVTTGTYADEYNANVFLYAAGFNSRRLLPVLPAYYTAAAGTFTYDNGTIRFKPFAEDTDISGCNLYVTSDGTYGINAEDCDNLTLTDIVALGSWYAGFRFEHCTDVTLQGCDAMANTHGSGFRVLSGNVKFYDCRGIGNQTDGFGLARYGATELISCTGSYNADDGVSHHDGCVGAVIGGEYSYNGSGGVTPAFGADVRVDSVFCKGNKYGVALFYASGRVRRTMHINSCILTDSTSYDIYNDGHYGVFSNCVYTSTRNTGSGTLTFYPAVTP